MCRADRRVPDKRCGPAASPSITRICTVDVGCEQNRRTPVARTAFVRTSDGGSRHVEVIERVAGRMGFGDVEGLEVMPFILEFGSVGDGKAKPPHDLLEIVHRLGQRVLAAQIERSAGKRDVDSTGDRLGAGGFLLPRFECRFDLRFGLVELLANHRPLRRFDLAQSV